MKIIGIQKSTTLDYPGKVACVIFTAGCNMRCPFCHNPEAVLPDLIDSLQSNLIPVDAFFRFLETRIGILDGVSICGGEPTLQNDLIDIVRKIKGMGFLVKIDTNGSNITLISQMISEGLIDYIAVDLKHIFNNYPIAIGTPISSKFIENYKILKDILLHGSIDYEYRTTLIKGFHTADHVIEMANSIYGAKNYYLQNYRPGNTLNPKFNGMSWTNQELQELSNLASPYVEYCGVRL